ncbi:potassium transporter TrkA [Longimonas halophila]|uniref:Potassium transporter TrkA n=1 Tax=Longimonas halophila TaxID=1469170 RepID=A0A2H3NXT0_9BACT|nr:NAD-binding protein [Longimonas halophila]PEN05210.1 potassium transporter TrkA [Longimonas halophila]
MKFYSTQLAYLFDDKEARRNLVSLFKYIGFLLLTMVVLSVGFQLIMHYVEGQSHTWVSAFYWTLVTMSTLGFGDITFYTDVGRLYSMFVVVTGIILLLIVLPFAFIRYFYAPWLEAQIHARAPRQVDGDLEGHVIFCNHDPVVPGLIERLDTEGVPYVLIESDPDRASDFYLDGVSVILGDVDDPATYEAARVQHAEAVIANRSDVENTNIALTVRETAPNTPIIAIAHSRDAIDILELSGCTTVLPLKHMLGEQLANRINAGHAECHPIGTYEDLVLAEMPVQGTPLEGRTVRNTNLRAETGVSIIGVWERGTLKQARPDTELTMSSVPVVIGTESQIQALNKRLTPYAISDHPVLVIGGGTVGEATARALLNRGIDVHIVERDASRCAVLRRLPATAFEGTLTVFEGDASDYALLDEAGIQEAPSVLLTTHDDAMNIYLASYCRRLNPKLRIVSRIVHQRNMEAIHRAGADFVLGYAMLGLESIWAALTDKELVVMGEGLDLFTRTVPAALNDQTLAESGIGARTGLTVVAVLCPNRDLITQVRADTRLEEGMNLLMVGTDAQYQSFVVQYG